MKPRKAILTPVCGESRPSRNRTFGGEGAVIPHVAAASHTGAIDWRDIELVVFGDVRRAEALVFLPGDRAPRRVVVEKTPRGFRAPGHACGEPIRWKIKPGSPGSEA